MTTTQDRTKAIEQAQALVKSGTSANKAAQTTGDTIGVSGRTVQRWAQQAGTPLGELAHDTAKKARDDQRAQYLASRETLKVRMSKLAHDLIDRCYDPHYDYLSSKDGPARVDYDTPRSGDIKNYVTSAAILIDKCRLEEGKATERTERLSVGAIEAWMAEQEEAMVGEVVNASDSR